MREQQLRSGLFNNEPSKSDQEEGDTPNFQNDVMLMLQKRR
jgi:hypothetical protein